MGSQHGELVRGDAHTRELRDWFRVLPAAFIRSALPASLRERGLLTGLLQRTTGTWADWMSRRRPDFAQQRTRGFYRAAAMPKRAQSVLFAMDVLQNAINGITTLQTPIPRAVPALAACSSVAAWGASTRDGRLLHARNFDFPAPELWNRAPAVVFCTPRTGQRYGFVTTWSGDVACVTAFNESGLTITPHTRFHRDFGWHGAGIVDICHALVRGATTLDEACALARRLRSASTWGILVSSAAERSAMILELTSRRCARVDPGREPWLCNTNHYLTDDLAGREAPPAALFPHHSRARLARLQQVMHHHDEAAPADVDDLLDLLGDHRQAETGKPVVAGSILNSPFTIQSVVVDPERQRVCLSTGAAPVTHGARVEIPWVWADQPGAFEIPVTSDEQEDTSWRRAVRAHARGCQANLQEPDIRAAEPWMEAALAAAPDDPSLQFINGAIALRRGDFGHAADLFSGAAAVSQAAIRRQRAAHWARACARAARGQRTGIAGRLQRQHNNATIDYITVDLALP
ncbi:MAG: hypothetical protein D6761_06495 [Candidatus Dadabacteria bacterium]|nr:MAG: hypothetical protein D6761_06495 [Candidatus Dadabacteria bacterium]